jgi:hypothetical protein
MIQSTPTPTSRARVAEFASRLSAVVLALPWAWTVAVVLGATTLLARSPGIVFTGLFDRDEAFLQVMGGVVGRGGEMYVDVIDRKPPIVPYLYALVHELSVDMRWVRLLCACAIFVNGLVIVALVRRLTSNRRAALAAGVLAVLGTALFLPADAQAANFELWGLLPASAAILAVVMSRDPRRSRTLMFLLAGACVAFAANCKQPYVVVLLPVLFEAARPRVDPRRPVGAVSTVSTVGAVVLGVVLATLPLLLVADPRRMWRWGWADNGDYLNGGISTSRALAVGAGLSLVFALFHLSLLYGLWAAVRRRVRVDPVLLVWLASSMLVLPIGLRFFGHYYQQLVPPLAAITGVALARATRTVRRAVLSLAALSSVALVGLAFVHPADLSNFTAVGRYVQSTTAPTDRILVWGALPDVYISADRPPAGVFLHDGYLTGNWASRASVLDASIVTAEPYRSRWAIFVADVESDPPTVIIDAARPGTDWAGYSPERYPLGALLQRCYTRVAVVDGLPVWRRDAQRCPA